ncbi:MAG: hypothetical protein J0H19_14130, partial [Rhodospirillales bacterium]|nr:hypothetical protein [Rhodospirillales bacterium]
LTRVLQGAEMLDQGRAGHREILFNEVSRESDFSPSRNPEPSSVQAIALGGCIPGLPGGAEWSR